MTSKPTITTNNNKLFFLQRHKKKLLITIILSVFTIITTTSIGVYLLNNWIKKQSFKLQQKRFLKEQIKRRFQQTQQDSIYTVYELLPVVAIILNNFLDLDDIVLTLKSNTVNTNNNTTTTTTASTNAESSDPANTNGNTSNSKLELWNALKIKSITKLCVSIYTLSSLLLLTRIQLNILARKEYLQYDLQEYGTATTNNKSNNGLISWLQSLLYIKRSDEQGAKEEDNLELNIKKNGYNNMYDIKYCNEQAFLSLSWWLLNRGYTKYSKIIEAQVLENFNYLGPKDSLTFQEFSVKISNILFKTNEQLLLDGGTVNGNNTNTLLSAILLPATSLEQFVLQQSVNPQVLKILNQDNANNNLEFRELVDETKKIIQSTASSIVLETLVNESFQYLMNQIEQRCLFKLAKKRSNNSSNDKDDNSVVEATFQIALLSLSCKDIIDKNILVNNSDGDILSLSGSTNTTTENNSSLLNKIDSIPELDDLSASVYSNI
ncbi:Pex3p SCDLUD_004736 [Saccharomycodes ludwigii]|uniref:Pex3p n=1 Tax=Saccharomycodes ludwigii TaxID=36035 RepID=UPI001E8439CC|nr:hypothetical protein SCDLUD_004736 [Saccharomycodes ludwigii]KAH3899299.1 hypothetical protein SCDLUD_004736 [Saccharomycodes ludwigii]